MTQQVEYVYEVYTWPTKKIISVRYWDLGVIDAQNSDSWSLRIKVMVGDNLRVCPHMWLFSMLDAHESSFPACCFISCPTSP